MLAEIDGCQAEGPSWVESALVRAEEAQAKLTLSVDVKARIAEARKVWSTLLFPSSTLEEWKYTNTDSIRQGFFEVSGIAASDMEEAKEILQGVSLGEDCVPVVFVDGVYSEELSAKEFEQGVTLTRGVKDGLTRVGSLEKHKTEAFAALSLALLTDGVEIAIGRGVATSKPISIVYVTTSRGANSVASPRVYVSAEESSQSCIVEMHVGAEGVSYLSLPALEIEAKGNAQVDHYRIQLESTKAYQVSNAVISQQESSTVRTHVFSFGSLLARNHVDFHLEGSNSFGLVNGLSVLAGKQHVDNATVIHHRAPSAESSEHFKGVYDDESRGVFSGTIIVDQIAQKTNAFQSNQSLLLSSNASIETKPQLKIWADDVKCSHGATVGQLDKEAMFYLQSRGISREDARAFLIHAFASEVVTSVTNQQVRDFVEGQIVLALEQSNSTLYR